MNDTLTTANQFGAGVPDFGTRLVFFCIGAFVVILGMILIYFKMDELDTAKDKKFK